MHVRSSISEGQTPLAAGLLALSVAAAMYFISVLASRTLTAEAVGLAKALIVAPVVEELFFRGVVQARLRALRGFWGQPWSVIAITALAFGAAHLVNASPLHAVLVIAPASALGWVFERTRSIGLCIALHSAANAVWIGFWSL